MNKSSVSTAAPLDQHVKENWCDGIKYKVVKEDPNDLKPEEINVSLKYLNFQVFAISPSRKAAMRQVQAEINKGKSKAQQKKLKKMDAGDCHAINAGVTAAHEEIGAEERDIRMRQADQEFVSNIKTAVKRRNQVQSATVRQRNIVHVSLRILIA